MLATLNQLAHGYVCIPAILACRRAGLFARLRASGESFESFAAALHANAGHLRTALRMLESLGWVSRSADDVYCLNDGGDVQSQIPEDVDSLPDFPFESCLQAERDCGLAQWLDRSVRGWDMEDAQLAALV